MQCVLAEPSGTLARHRCVHQPQHAHFDGAGNKKVLGCWLPAAGAISLLPGVFSQEELATRSALGLCSAWPALDPMRFSCLKGKSHVKQTNELNSSSTCAIALYCSYLEFT